MRVHPMGDLWIIARNLRPVPAQAVSGSATGAAIKDVFDCWTGVRWAGRRKLAITFPTREEAQKYLDENRGTLEQAR
jgi:cell wall-associated NlpC family hydrolase